MRVEREVLVESIVVGLALFGLGWVVTLVLALVT